LSFDVFINDSILGIVGSKTQFKKIDNGEPGELQGAWLLSGEIRDGKEKSEDPNTPIITMRIFSGTRFQRITYNIEAKQFIRTVGGTYTAINGEYAETIEFLSNYNSKPGAIINSNYSLNDGKWNHIGNSSQVDPINEIWSVWE